MVTKFTGHAPKHLTWTLQGTNIGPIWMHVVRFQSRPLMLMLSFQNNLTFLTAHCHHFYYNHSYCLLSTYFMPDTAPTTSQTFIESLQQHCKVVHKWRTGGRGTFTVCLRSEAKSGFKTRSTRFQSQGSFHYTMPTLSSTSLREIVGLEGIGKIHAPTTHIKHTFQEIQSQLSNSKVSIAAGEAGR